MIYKYTITNPFGTTKLILPYDFKFLDMQLQNDDLVMWIDIISKEAEDTFTVKAVPTGQSKPIGDYDYLKTVQHPNGLVFHYYIV